jgi:hypothetical protein
MAVARASFEWLFVKDQAPPGFPSPPWQPLSPLEDKAVCALKTALSGKPLATFCVPAHTAAMKRTISLALSVLLTGGLTGCLEFERQTLSYRHDTATDTLFIFQDYQGIFGDDDAARLTESEIDQMASVIKVERTFFFNNWITEYNRRALQDLQEKPPGELDANPAYEAAARKMANVALANVKVENVGLYLNHQNQLCGAQRVTVRNVSTVLAALNKVLQFLAREQAGKEDKSEEEKRLLLKFADSGQDALRLEGNRLEIRWPVTREDYQTFRDRTPSGTTFRESGGEIQYTNSLIVLTLGHKDAKPVTLTLPFSEKPYAGNAVAEAEKYGVMKSFDATAAARKFLQVATGAGEGKKQPR